MRPFSRTIRASVTLAAVALALSGTAVARHLFTGADIRNGSLTGADIRDGSIGARDLRAGTVREGSRGPAGQPGPVGPPGPAGAIGPAGPSGVAGVWAASMAHGVVLAPSPEGVILVDIETGQHAPTVLQGMVALRNGGNAAETVRCFLSQHASGGPGSARSGRFDQHEVTLAPRERITLPLAYSGSLADPVLMCEVPAGPVQPSGTQPEAATLTAVLTSSG